MIRECFFCSLVLIASAAGAGSAFAQTIFGDWVSFHREGLNNTDDMSAVVGNQLEFPWFSQLAQKTFLNFDVREEGIAITALEAVEQPDAIYFAGVRTNAYFEIYDIDWVGAPSCRIVGLDIDLSNWSDTNTVSGDFSFGEHSVRWYIGGLQVAWWNPGDTILLTWTTSIPKPPVLTIRRGTAPNTLVLEWDRGILYYTENLEGPWIEMSGATSPHFFDASWVARRFWQARSL